MIHRSHHKDCFTVIDNAVLRDMRLSDGAARLLMYMLSMSDDWNFSTRSLAKAFNVSNSTIVERITELKAAGYIVTTKQTDKKGRFSACTWEIFEKPHSEITEHGKNRTREKPHTEKTVFGEIGTYRNTNIKEISTDKKEEKSIKKNSDVLPLADRKEIYFACKKLGG